MNDLLEFIKKSIVNKGFDFNTCYLENFPITVTNEIFIIDAANEFYFLYDVNNVTDDFAIKCDNEYISKANFVFNGLPSGYRELTGQIIINNVGAVDSHTFMMYRVVINTRLKK